MSKYSKHKFRIVTRYCSAALKPELNFKEYIKFLQQILEILSAFLHFLTMRDKIFIAQIKALIQYIAEELLNFQKQFYYFARV